VVLAQPPMFLVERPRGSLALKVPSFKSARMVSPLAREHALV
jgi:hypothetical protein